MHRVGVITIQPDKRMRRGKTGCLTVIISLFAFAGFGYAIGGLGGVLDCLVYWLIFAAISPIFIGAYYWLFVMGKADSGEKSENP